MTSFVSESRQSIFGAGQTQSCFVVFVQHFTDILSSVFIHEDDEQQNIDCFYSF
jgi:hypothetical protein